MIVLAKKNYGTWKKIFAVFLVCLIFSIGNRSGTDLTYEQHILSAATDHYYMTYFLLPMVLFCCYTFIEDDAEIVISRFGSYFSYFTRKWMGTGLVAGSIVLSQSIAILLSGIGLVWNNTWLLHKGALETDLFSVLCRFFSAPAEALFAVLIFEFMGIWIVSGISMWICHFTGQKWTVRILVVLYVFSALWIKISAVQHLPLTGLNHLLILHHNFTTPWRFWVTVSTVVLLILILLLTVRLFWRNKFRDISIKRHGIRNYYLRQLFTKKNIIILLAVVTGITLYKGLQNPFVSSGEEWVYFLFLGHGAGYFQIFPFLELLITGGTPLYLLAAFIEKAVSGQSLFIPIRLKNRRELMAAIIRIGICFILFYSALWGTAGLLSCFGFGYALTKESVQVLINAVFMKGLDIFLQYLLMIVLYIFTKQVTVGFLALVGANFLCILPQNISAFLPFGLSSMARISILSSYPGIEAVVADSVFLTGILLLLCWLLLTGQKRLLT